MPVRPVRPHLSRRKFVAGAGCGLIGAFAGAGGSRAEPFNIDTIENWLLKNGGYYGDEPGATTGSVSPANAPAGQPADRSLQPSTAHEPHATAPRPPAESPVDYPIERIDPKTIKPQFRRTVVAYDGPHWPGTVVVDTRNRHLYLVLEGRRAIRYGVGVGRDGFTWAGEAYIGRKARWPRWTPPKEMVARDPRAAPWANGMPGGPDNPLGARALYLFDLTGRDTLYRIHGTNEPQSIGKALSSGCIRLLNQDIDELHRRVAVGSRVVVLDHGG